MSFTTYLNKAWSEHAANPEAVSKQFLVSLSLVSESSHILQLTQLITHVMGGDHLAKYADGVRLLESLDRLELNSIESKTALKRAKAILQYSADPDFNILDFSGSEQIRIAAAAGSALIGQGKIIEASRELQKALLLAKSLPTDDPANRSLAITGNNIATALEEKTPLMPAEKELMLLAANTGHKYWKISGTWLEVERAEYRLANSHMKALNIDEALKHGRRCLQICEENKAHALEFFFAYEALAMTKKVPEAVEKMEEYFLLLNEEDRVWCKSSLDKAKL